MDKASLGAFTHCLRKVAETLKIECSQDLPAPPDSRTKKDLWEGKLTSRYANNAGKMFDSLVRMIARGDFSHQPIEPSSEDISSARKILGTKLQFIALARQQFEAGRPRRETEATGTKIAAEPVKALSQSINAEQAAQCETLSDTALLSDYLTGFGFREFMGSEDDWRKTVHSAKKWLIKNPEDFYCRGMLFWSILRKGNPGEIVVVLNETAQWLTSDPPAAGTLGAGGDMKVWRRIIEEKIEEIVSGAIELPDFVRWHIEDTLVRATLLRYLRFQGKKALLKSDFAKLGRDLEKQYIMKVMSAPNKPQPAESWVSIAVAHASQWTKLEMESGLARLCLIWFTGRQGQPDQMHAIIDQSCRWLERNTHQTIVRWGTLWLAGMCPDTEQIVGLINETAKWLESGAPDPDRMVRMVYLWLVGAKGTTGQIQRAIAENAAWLNAHPEDDFIRSAHLLSLVRRRANPDQRRKAMADVGEWLRDHPDVHGLTQMALGLCAAAPA